MKIISKVVLVSMVVMNLGQSMYALTQGKDVPKLLALLKDKNTKNIYMPDADLRQVQLSKVDFSPYEEVNLHKTNLSEANLQGANLSGEKRIYLDGNRSQEYNKMDLSAATLKKTNLNGANLSGAELSYADFTSVSLIGTNLSGTNLSNAKGLSNEQKAYARKQGALNVPQ